MKLDKNQRKPRIFKAFDLVLIITRESILRTIPVAFIFINPFLAFIFKIALILFAKKSVLYKIFNLYNTSIHCEIFKCV